MRSISQRELRNDNAEIVRGVERGESYTVTRRGVPVARLVPVTDLSDLACARPAKTRVSYTTRPRVEASTTTQAMLDDLRDDR